MSLTDLRPALKQTPTASLTSGSGSSFIDKRHKGKRQLRFQIIDPWLKELTGELDTISTVNVPDVHDQREREEETKSMLRGALSKLQNLGSKLNQPENQTAQLSIKPKHKSKKHKRFKLKNDLDCIPEDERERSNSRLMSGHHDSESTVESTVESTNTKATIFLNTLRDHDSYDVSSRNLSYGRSNRHRGFKTNRTPVRQTLPPIAADHDGYRQLGRKQQAMVKLKQRPSKLRFLKDV